LDWESVSQAEKEFFTYLNIEQRKLTYKNYMDLLALYLSEHSPFSIYGPRWRGGLTGIDHLKVAILSSVYFWATGWDWKLNRIPEDCVKFQNKVRKYFKYPPLTEEQIYDYEFTNGEKNV